MKKVSIVLLLAIAIVVGFVFLLRHGTPPKQGTPQIVVTPENALLDEPVEIVISNLPANAHVTLEASLKDKDNNAWIAQATFQANDNGVVNVAKQASISGTYTGIDPMGLFWSMKPTMKDSTLPMLVSLNLTPFELSIFSDNKLLTQKTIYRRYIAPDVETKEIREQGIVGTLFYPKGKKSPGVIMIPGSTGWLPAYVAQLLASHGYAVFELRYFGQEGLPKNMSLIPLEYFERAMHWFKKQPHVDGNKIALMGQSTGGELALLLAATFSGQMNAIIALSAPSFVLGTWTYKNKPVLFVSLSDQEMLETAREGRFAVPKGTIEHPFRWLGKIYLYAMKTGKFIKEAMIPVENICCPLLILSGDDDTLWPCSLFGKNIMERLDAYGSKIKRRFINYLNAGNNLLLIPPVPSIDLPFQLLDGSWSIHGGTTEGNARAHKEAWQEILNFLKQMLKEPMIKNNTPIKGGLITLKPLQEQFFEEYHNMFSPVVRQTVGLPPTSELHDTATFLKATMSDPQHLVFYCIFDNQSNKLIGSVVIRTPDYPNGQLGAWLNENFWGGGRYQEALYLALKKYFESTSYDSIFAFVEVGNERSLKAHQKMGFEIVEKSPKDKNRLQGKQTHKIVLTRAAFERARQRFEGNPEGR